MSFELQKTSDDEILWTAIHNRNNNYSDSQRLQIRGREITLSYDKIDDPTEYDDTLDRVVIKLHHHSEETDKLPENQNQKIFVDEMQELLDNGKYSDITMVVNDTEWPVHKAILTARSKVFKAMLEEHTKECKENKIVIEDIDVGTMKEILKYIYTGKVSDIKITAFDLVAPAEKYQLEGLILLCDEVLADNVTAVNMQSMLTLVNLFDLKLLKKNVFSFMDQNPELFEDKDFSDFLQKLSPSLLTEIITSSALSKKIKSKKRKIYLH